MNKSMKIPKVKIAREGRLEDILLQRDWDKAPSLECLHFHRQTQLFLSAHVDDIKMGGRRASLAPTHLIDQVYLGCTRLASTTKMNFQDSVQEEILGYEEDLTRVLVQVHLRSFFFFKLCTPHDQCCFFKENSCRCCIDLPGDASDGHRSLAWKASCPCLT